MHIWHVFWNLDHCQIVIFQWLPLYIKYSSADTVVYIGSEINSKERRKFKATMVGVNVFWKTTLHDQERFIADSEFQFKTLRSEYSPLLCCTSLYDRLTVIMGCEQLASIHKVTWMLLPVVHALQMVFANQSRRERGIQRRQVDSEIRISHHVDAPKEERKRLGREKGRGGKEEVRKKD